VKQTLATRDDAAKLRRLDNRIRHWTKVLTGAQTALRVLRQQRDELAARMGEAR